ncbi:MAG: hypothetical protein COW18_05755 [Zetaproteobacteria bacterium CG12_big_fil_rev_8_21_14_0_65_54_13]|nr:MAG: hypothetical protein COX55_02010 [Zetaproteobacteria bacterium CG23_combo_of_CG06-09_8_20_14_all_54_7]PIW49314.1 MAG: hypothetical protein COW18_05755 [Zetaproteobacteria bacterium CG12_big_fil_rev_8_21_14_0_65_54_13]PIX53487.1 MAG: hypothetical protein COZ50_13000 [Zetaproteobacteria bacterium CG_4_10_14_3_um_filter_54_28]PJA27667.1 MAG: hypothetical protein CO188_11780 [Zetaproteobacteria bacterium CG_4_9_14_3_um_filter_54_145]
MSSSIQTEPSKESQVMLDTLKTAVADALEKKRRLGQYAVVWKNGKPVRIGADSIGVSDNKSKI